MIVIVMGNRMLLLSKLITTSTNSRGTRVGRSRACGDTIRNAIKLFRDK